MLAYNYLTYPAITEGKVSNEESVGDWDEDDASEEFRPQTTGSCRNMAAG